MSKFLIILQFTWNKNDNIKSRKNNFLVDFWNIYVKAISNDMNDIFSTKVWITDCQWIYAFCNYQRDNITYKMGR